ncbi:MAG: hypothetical protein M1826_000780 [Phylliscum demangeonii]|nr:MAG: hypothetical protein M1826_000780 [Phylliscum demangeonii]
MASSSAGSPALERAPSAPSPPTADSLLQQDTEQVVRDTSPAELATVVDGLLDSLTNKFSAVSAEILSKTQDQINMPIIQGLEVRIESAGFFLPEHHALEGSTSHRKTRYLEITPGATFAIHLVATDRFEYQRANGLQVAVRFDDQAWMYLALTKLDARLFKKNRRTYFCEESGTWKRSKFAFAAANHVPDDEVASPESMQHMGQIRIDVRRALISKPRRPTAWRPRSMSRPALVSKKLLVEEGLSHVIACVPGPSPPGSSAGLSAERLAAGWKKRYAPDQGRATQLSPCLDRLAEACILPFIIERRPEMLEHLRCLPPSPHLLESGEPRQTVDADGTRTAPVDIEDSREEGRAAGDAFPAGPGLTAEEEQELKEIKARYAVLRQKHARGDPAPKQETNGAPAGAAIGSQPRPPAAVKRERPEVIDLTLD